MNIVSYTIGLSLLSTGKPNGWTANSRGAGSREQLSAEGRRILSLLDGRPLGEQDLQREEQGRPYFPDHHADFNISHSGSMAAVSIVKAGTGAHFARTGCDIQQVRPRPNTAAIAEQFFTPAERRFIFSPDASESIAPKFYMIWVLKECYLKLKGLTVFDMAAVPSFISDVDLPITFNLYELAGSSERYMLAAAVENAGASQERVKPNIRWFSQSVLKVRSIAAINAEPEK